MPVETDKQKRFFQLVKAVKLGKVPRSRVGNQVRKAAKAMGINDINDFITETKVPVKNSDMKSRRRLAAVLKELQEPSYLQENQSNPVSKEFTVKGKEYESYVNEFKGIPFTQKEHDSINNFTEEKPIKADNIVIRYETTDDFQNNTTTTIKKLKEGNTFIYSAFSKYTSSKSDDANQGDIIVTKSAAFTDDIKGSQILSDFIKHLDI